jgi:hypothetical protein
VGGGGGRVDILSFLLSKISKEKTLLQENEEFDKRDKKKAQITFPFRHFFSLKVVK